MQLIAGKVDKYREGRVCVVHKLNRVQNMNFRSND